MYSKDEISTEMGANVADVRNLLHAMDHDPFFLRRHALPERLQEDPQAAEVDVPHSAATAEAKNPKDGDKAGGAKAKAKGKAKAKAKAKFQKETMNTCVNVLCVCVYLGVNIAVLLLPADCASGDLC